MCVRALTSARHIQHHAFTADRRNGREPQAQRQGGVTGQAQHRLPDTCQLAAALRSWCS